MAKRKSGRYRAIPHYYDAEYAGGDVLDNDVPFLLEHLPLRPQRVLELCCGTGRAAIPIAQAGHRVTAQDIDRDLLRIARQKRNGAGLSDRRLALVQGDVLKLDYGSEFDWAFLIFNTLLNFTTLAEQDRLLRGVHAALKPRGRFWIDVFNPDFRILATPHYKEFESTTFFVPECNRAVRRTTEIRRSPKRPQLQEVTFHYTWTSEDGKPQREAITFEMTWMLPRELTLLLERNGFEVQRLYGDYDGNAVTPDSPRLIALAKKR
jgi:SAM-dependent methyltransferase